MENYRSASQFDAFEIIEQAVQMGVDTVDTALSYGDGGALQRLSRWSGGSHRRPEIALKIGRPQSDGAVRPDLRASQLLHEVAVATDAAWPPSYILLKDPPFAEGARLARLLTLIRNSFKNERVGISTHSLAVLDSLCTLERQPDRPVVELEFNGLTWTVMVKRAERLRELGWEVWGMQPLAYGALATLDFEHRVFGKGDWRGRLDDTSRLHLATASRRFVERLQNFDRSSNPAVLALAFCFARQELDRVVVGPKSTSQLHDIARAIELAASPAGKQMAHLDNPLWPR